MMRLLFSGNTAWSMYNFRKEVLQECVTQGYEVFVVAPDDAEFRPRIEALGCTFVPMQMSANSLNPMHDLALLFKYMRVIRKYRINYCFFYTIKPNIYGSLAALLLGIKHIPMVTGMGSVFIKKSFVSALVSQLYKISFLRSERIWLLNDNDRQVFLSNRLAPESKTEVLPGGEGVNIRKFEYSPITEDGTIRFLILARMLWDKGIGEFIEAARVLKNRYPNVRFQLLGFIGVENPTAISRSQIDAWVGEGVIEYLGTTTDVRPMVQASTCIVLPSKYKEGLPISLLEGAAMGRPLIATNIPGCKEVVDDGVNGYLCQMGDVPSLIDAMERIILLSPEERAALGTAGYKKVHRQFDIRHVVDLYLRTLNPMRETASVRTSEQRLNISIVLYENRFDEVRALVDTLRQSPVVNNVFLIDNSKNYNKAYESLPAVYLFNNKNIGYGKGHNLALRQSIEHNLPYHLAINVDIHFDPAILTQIITYMEANPNIGSLMPKVYYPDGETQYLCRLLPSPIDLIGRRFFPNRLMKKRIARLEMHSTDYNHLLDVPHISGCFMMLRTEALREVGLFDPRYFLYLEDIDLTRRIREKYRTVFYPYVSIVHEHTQGSYKNSHLLRVHVMNAIRYFNKWGWVGDKERQQINEQTMAQAELQEETRQRHTIN